MNRLTQFFSVFVLIFITYSCSSDKLNCDVPLKSNMMIDKIKGMSLVVAQKPIPNNLFSYLDQIGVDWVSFIPQAYYHKGNTSLDSVHYCNEPDCPFDADTRYAIIEAIQMCKTQGLNVMIKPHLLSPDEWVGELTFDTEAEWDTFETNYSNYIMEWVAIAVAHDVELFCIGTELSVFVKDRPSFWINLITNIRQVYSGALTYAANWDDYTEVSFWDSLDYVGVDAYFPLLPEKTPLACQLTTVWQPYLENLKNFSVLHNKPVLFTEFGYLSIDGCAYNTWDLEKNIMSFDINEQGQANAIQALLETFGNQDFWAGGFQWKWYADALGTYCQEDINRDYTPEGKIAEDVLRIMYD